MFLKSLTLKGFKSFADTTTLQLEPGVTVVVGPNGSGKSNVVDAVAWVLGAQGPKTVRSTKMEDVIFAGTPKRSALGRAEVSLCIDNSSGLLPIDFAEVTITRTLWRSGDSEYAINGSPCRLLDVQELLSDTGLGRQQHVIISQGQLDAILNARPEDRRGVIEEAAGVLKHRRRKEKAERRLESTEASLLRAQDLLREVRRQLRPLERQAEAARRHDELSSELNALRRHIAGRELASIESRLGASGAARVDLTLQEKQVLESLARFDAEVIQTEATLDAARERSDTRDLAEAVSAAEGLRARARGLSALLEERLRRVERERAVNVDNDVVSSLEAESADLGSQLAQTEIQGAELEPAAQELEEAEKNLQADAEAVEQRWGLSSAVEGVSAQQTLGQVRGELSSLEAAEKRTAAEASRLSDKDRSLSERTQRLRAETTRLAEVVEQCEAAKAELAAKVEEAAAAMTAAESEEVTSAERRRDADGELHRWRARAEALSQALDEARARAGAQRLSGVEGVLGALVELVEVDPGFEAAFEAAAGDVLSAVVVDSEQSARASLDHLAQTGNAGAVVAADIGSGRSKPGAGQLLSPPAGSELLRSHVRARTPAMENLLDTVVGDAVVVDATLLEAIDFVLQNPGLVVVTLSGDRFAHGLWRTGAGGAGATGAALEEALAAAESAAIQVETLAGEEKQARARLAESRTAHAEALRAKESNTNRLSASSESARRMGSEMAEADSEAESLQAQKAELESRLQRESARAEELRAALPELEQSAQEETSRALAERLDRSRLAERASAVAALRRDLEVRAAGLEERRAVLTKRLADVEQRLERNVVERQQAAARREMLDAQAVAIRRLSDVVAASSQVLESSMQSLRAARSQEQEAARSTSDRLENLRRQRSAAERELAEIRERRSRAEMDETEAKVRLESLTESVRRELDCEPEATRGAECPELPPGVAAASRLRELEREIRMMGPVNLLALEELGALQERHAFLEGQLEDVRSARRELNKVIKAVDEEIVEVFKAAYTDVAQNFEKLFSTLFPGGQGGLRLTEPDNPLETGIEIEAKPSGKNVRRLSLLSGGERSLTALAFLFAVFRSRPSPFYLMDEVEAALDDLNLHRFLDLVHEFRSEAQLLIVSHQKRTMEAADCLYGVTMVPGGSSRVISEKVETPSHS